MIERSEKTKDYKTHSLFYSPVFIMIISVFAMVCLSMARSQTDDSEPLIDQKILDIEIHRASLASITLEGMGQYELENVHNMGYISISHTKDKNDKIYINTLGSIATSLNYFITSTVTFMGSKFRLPLHNWQSLDSTSLGQDISRTEVNYGSTLYKYIIQSHRINKLKLTDINHHIHLTRGQVYYGFCKNNPTKLTKLGIIKGSVKLEYYFVPVNKVVRMLPDLRNCYSSRLDGSAIIVQENGRMNVVGSMIDSSFAMVTPKTSLQRLKQLGYANLPR